MKTHKGDKVISWNYDYKLKFPKKMFSYIKIPWKKR